MLGIWQNWIKCYVSVKRLCVPVVHSVVGNWRCLAVSEARKFPMEEKNEFSDPGNFEVKRIFTCHVSWSTKQTEKYDLFVQS